MFGLSIVFNSFIVDSNDLNQQLKNYSGKNQTADLVFFGFIFVELQFSYVVGYCLHHNDNVCTTINYNGKAILKWAVIFDNNTWIENNSFNQV